MTHSLEKTGKTVSVKFVKACFLTVALIGTAALTVQAAADQSDKSVKVSQALVQEAHVKLKAGEAMDALRLFESAMVADPRNTRAYVGLGEVYGKLERAQDGLRYFEIALQIDPNDLGALEAQSYAFIGQGRIADAEQNLNRLRRICVKGCSELDRVNTAIGQALDEKVGSGVEPIAKTAERKGDGQ